MKTTIELPDPLFRKAKSLAAQEGLSLKTLFSIALENEIKHLAQSHIAAQKWRKYFGAMKNMHDENLEIQREIDKQFNTIDEEIWN